MEDFLSISYWEYIMGVMGVDTSSLFSSPKDHTQIIHSSHIEEKRMERVLDSVAPPCDNQVQERRENEISILLEEECNLDSSHKVPNENGRSAIQVKEDLPKEIGKRRKAKKSKASSEKGNDGKFLCKECHRSFTTKNNARLHNLSHKTWEELEGETVYHEKCGECNKIFFTKRDFQTHVDTHKRVRRLKCQHCDKTFTRQVSLISHSFVHLTEEEKGKVKESWKNNCYFCSERFSAHSHLIVHMVTHTKERAFTCLTCTKTFTTNGSLTEHKRCHSKETRRAFKCKTCAKSFTQKGHLSIHIRSVHLKEFHKCLYCPKTYTQKGTIQAHMKKEHHN